MIKSEVDSMMKINLTINGVEVTANAGQTILAVAKENSVFIPTLCHDDRIKPFGSCLLCRVEVEGARGNMLACATPVTEGMIVRTESDGISDARKMCLELLVSQHHGDCKAPCSITCPAEIDIQAYIAHIANGQYQEAIRVIKERNPLPVVCGRICTRPCEDQCRRNLVDERVGIDYLKRFASDFDLNSDAPYMPETLPRTGKKVAIVGAGPAGLSCAYYLSVLGYDATIFEKWEHGGGMLRYGIPEYRLPRGPLAKEIELIKKLGVEIRYNTTFGKDVIYPQLKKEGYEALFLAVGSQLGQPLGLPNDNLEGVMSGVEFLGKVNSDQKIDFTGKKVVVIGGGNTALDTARTSLRLNATEVILAYRRTRAEMPAHEMEVEEAEYEGVHLELLVAPRRLVENKNSVSGVEFVRMRLGEPDATGRRKPEEIAGSEFIMECDVVLGAIGQTQDLSFINEDLSLNIERNRIVINKDVMTTNVEGVFAGGDVVTGPDAAISAIAAGRRAAYAINQYLKGDAIEKLPQMYNHVKGKLNELDPKDFEQYEKIKREVMPMLSKEERHNNFKEVELGLSEDAVKREAMRCLSCGCKDVNECKLRDYTTKYEVHQDRLMGEITIHPIDDSHEFITRDPNKCIMCGRCVRICMEVQGAGVLGFVDRGYNTIVTPSFEMPFGEDKRCEKCGQCVSTCPVGALTEKPQLLKPGPFVEEMTSTTCNGCGTGCSMILHTVGDTLVRKTAEVGVGVNNGNLCEKGRFGGLERLPQERLSGPYIKQDGVLKAVSLDEAFEYIRVQLGKIRLEHGDSSIGVFASPDMTNEELEGIKRLAKDALNTDKFVSVNIPETYLGLQNGIKTTYAKANYADIDASDYIVCLGFDIKETNPVVALMVKKAAENGCGLVIIDNKETRLARFASNNWIGSNDEIIKLLIESKGFLFEGYRNAEKPLFIIGDETDSSVAEAVGKFMVATKDPVKKVLFMHNNCNMRGMIEMGASFGIVNMDLLKASILFGVDEKNELKDVPFKIVCTTTLTDTIEDVNANVILPMASFSETDGSFTNSEGRVQFVKKAIKTANGFSNCEIIERIISAMEIKE